MNFFGFTSESDIAIFWVEFFSTIFFAATVAVLVWESILQRKGIIVDEYAELRQHHHDLITLQIENKETLDIFNEVKVPEHHKDISNNDKIVLCVVEKQIFQFYVAEFDLYERVWSLKKEKQKLKKSEWLCWLIYLESMSHHWLFRYTFNHTRTIFDAEFMNNVRENIIDPQNSKEDNAREKLEEEVTKAYLEEGEKVEFPKGVDYIK